MSRLSTPNRAAFASSDAAGNRRADVVVVGGGVIGLSIAWRTACRGLSVAVVDDGREQRASWAAAGMLSPLSEFHAAEEELLELNLRSAQRYPSFVAELEQASSDVVAYRRCGTLVVAFDAGDATELDDLHALQLRHGLDTERLRGSQCRDLEPALAAGVRAGVHLPDDHQVDNRRLERALREAARRAGVALVAGTATAIEASAGRVEGVRLDGGAELRAGSAVVVAAGCWSERLLTSLGLQLPVRPVKGQILRLRARPKSGAVLPERTVRAVVHGSAVYIAPRADGELVVGATMEEQGYDTIVTAGAVHELLHDARAVLPGLDEAELVECRAGLRPGSPDNLPLIGSLGRGAPDGLVVAAGHGRHGILLAPLTADAVAALLAQGSLPPLLDVCNPTRFSARVAGLVDAVAPALRS